MVVLLGAACATGQDQSVEPRAGQASEDHPADGQGGTNQHGADPGGANHGGTDGTNDAGSSDGGEAPSSDGADQEVPAGAKPLPQGQIVDEGPTASADRKQVWVSGNGRTITVVAQEAGCGSATARVTGQQAERVQIRATELVRTAPGMACTMDIRYPKLNVSVDEPLGERTVVIERTKKRVD